MTGRHNGAAEKPAIQAGTRALRLPAGCVGGAHHPAYRAAQAWAVHCPEIQAAISLRQRMPSLMRFR